MWTGRWRPRVGQSRSASLLIVGFVAGILFWGGFNRAMEVTNTEQFCISCHEMKDNVYREYRSTIHYSNRSGVRAILPGLPRAEGLVAQDRSARSRRSNELFHQVLGTIDTPEKFDDKRLELADERVAADEDRPTAANAATATSSSTWTISAQETRASETHQDCADATGKTCIDCHHGIAHKLPPNADEAYQKVVETLDQSAKKRLSDYLSDAVGTALASPVTNQGGPSK